MGPKPVLDQIEFASERGILVIIALVIIIITLAMVVKAVLTVVEIVKTTRTKEVEDIIVPTSKENFFYNLIEEDIANSDIPLSDEAKKLISTYGD